MDNVVILRKLYQRLKHYKVIYDFKKCRTGPQMLAVEHSTPSCYRETFKGI